jgi:hypothetical protein
MMTMIRHLADRIARVEASLVQCHILDLHHKIQFLAMDRGVRMGVAIRHLEASPHHHPVIPHLSIRIRL